ncbi:MAG: insulinase family protein, partial [Proteobacteria bacterium]|nr:insulinase family protein [Pseudomonadota bacterium]
MFAPLVATAGKSTRADATKPSEATGKLSKPEPVPTPALAKRRDALDHTTPDPHSDGPSPAGVQHAQLKNGMRVYFVADPRTPSVVVQVWYRVGSADEPVGVTGISHMLEHMMFWNHEKKEKNLYRQRIEAMGGLYNAFTSYDYTAYFANVASVHLEQIIGLEAKRMRKLKFTPGHFEKERQVVLEERHLRVNNRPGSRLREQMLIAAYERSGLRNPIIGWDDDIRAVSEDDMYAWYQRWYQPANAALVVVGDTDFDTVIALAKKYFARISNDDIDALNHQRPTEPDQSTWKRIVHRAPGRAEQVKMMWKIPSLDRETFNDEQISDSVGLDVLSIILGLDNSGWLYRRLVKESELALSVNVWTNTTLRTGGRFWIQARPRQGVSLEKLEKAIITELAALSADNISAADLERARTELIVETTYLRDSPYYQAMVIGQLEFSGAGWQMLGNYDKLAGQISADDVLAVAKQYLNEVPYV